MLVADADEDKTLYPFYKKNIIWFTFLYDFNKSWANSEVYNTMYAIFWGLAFSYPFYTRHRMGNWLKNKNRNKQVGRDLQTDKNRLAPAVVNNTGFIGMAGFYQMIIILRVESVSSFFHVSYNLNSS